MSSLIVGCGLPARLIVLPFISSLSHALEIWIWKYEYNTKQIYELRGSACVWCSLKNKHPPTGAQGAGGQESTLRTAHDADPPH